MTLYGVYREYSITLVASKEYLVGKAADIPR